MISVHFIGEQKKAAGHFTIYIRVTTQNSTLAGYQESEQHLT